MNATSVESTTTERQTVGETKTKIETKISLKEISASTGNETSVVKEATRQLAAGKRKGNRKTMTSTTFLWGQHYVDKSKMKCEIKGSVNMKLQYRQTEKLTEVLYVPQSVKYFERIKDCLEGCYNEVHSGKMIIKNNGVSMTLYGRDSQNKSAMFYLKAKIYSPEGKEALTDIPENKLETSNKKEE